MLQARRLWVRFLKRSLDFLIDLILPATLCSNRNECQEIFLGVKGSWGVRLAASLPSLSSLSRKFGILDVSQPCGPPQPVTGLAFSFCQSYVLKIYKPNNKQYELIFQMICLL
jgi:hypothetical protein